MLKSLFSSNTRVKLLTLFLTNPQKKFYLREIEKLIGENVTSIRREVFRLKNIGFLNYYQGGNIKYYKVNKKFILYSELKKIIFKTTGIKGELKRVLGKIKGIEAAFIFGSYAQEKETEKSDIDLMVVGDANYDQLLKAVRNIEKSTDREIDIAFYNHKEFAKKIRDNYFINNVLKSPKIDLIKDVKKYVGEIASGRKIR